MLMFNEKGPGIHIVGFGRMVGIAIAILIMMKVFKADWLVIVNTMLFAISNGYVQTICCIYAASGVDESHSQAIGNLIVIAITLGVSVGGLI